MHDRPKPTEQKPAPDDEAQREAQARERGAPPPAPRAPRAAPATLCCASGRAVGGFWSTYLLDTVGLWPTEKPSLQISGQRLCRHWILASSQNRASSTRKRVGIMSMPPLQHTMGTMRPDVANTSICLAWSMTTPEEHACVAPCAALPSPETSRSASAKTTSRWVAG